MMTSVLPAWTGNAVPRRPREIAPGIFWLGGCTETKAFVTQVVHVHSSTYLVRGGLQALMVDTGNPRDWRVISADLDKLLAGRQLDWLAPTHPELAHCGNLRRLLLKYPGAQVVGDIRDYHLYYPEFIHRFVPLSVGDEVDLGGGYRIVLLEALIKDLPNTQWVYEPSQGVMFVSDGFSYTHHPPVDDEPVHLPSECAMLSSELPAIPSVEQAAFLTRAALYWTRFVDVSLDFERFEQLLTRYPARMIAPAHGSVIVDIDQVMPVIREAHRVAYKEGSRPP